jgi:hypothetical protein
MCSEVTTATTAAALDLTHRLHAETNPLLDVLRFGDLKTLCEYDTSLIDELLGRARKILDGSGNAGSTQVKKPKTAGASRIYEFVDGAANILVDDETLANVSTAGWLSDQIIETYLW